MTLRFFYYTLKIENSQKEVRKVSSLKIVKVLVVGLLINFLFFSNISAEEEGLETFYIKIKISEKKLILIKNEKRIKEFPIAVPAGNYYPLPLTGKITEIEYNPFWYPTEGTRRDYFRKWGVELPRIISPGHPQNAMGKVKFIIKFEDSFTPLVRIHGTNESDSIGKRITRGCVRLFNQDILELAKMIEGTKTFVRFEN